LVVGRDIVASFWTNVKVMNFVSDTFVVLTSYGQFDVPYSYWFSIGPKLDASFSSLPQTISFIRACTTRSGPVSFNSYVACLPSMAFTGAFTGAPTCVYV